MKKSEQDSVASLQCALFFHYSSPFLLSVFLPVGLVGFACFAHKLRAGFADRRSGEGNAVDGAADCERVGASAYDTVRSLTLRIDRI